MCKNLARQCKSFACIRFSLRYVDGMKTASDIIAYLGGREAVADLVGVKLNAVRMAETAGKLPAAWFMAIEQAARQPLPRDAFTFKSVKVQP
jgi:hypothetical protein